jgi:hypothetical protein
MRFASILNTLLPALLLAACDSPATTRLEQAAGAAAEQWLARTDDGDHAGAWEMGAVEFRGSIRKEVWEAAQTNSYRQLGKPDRRELIAAKHTTSTLALGPGFMQGDYVLIQYRRPFHSGTVLETLVMKRNGDDWRPAQYTLRPCPNLRC